MDGRFHAWVEDRGPVDGLLTMIDDATGCTLGQFMGEETTWGAADILQRWISRTSSVWESRASWGTIGWCATRIGPSSFFRRRRRNATAAPRCASSCALDQSGPRAHQPHRRTPHPTIRDAVVAHTT